jgi:hypothetical protein
MRTEACGVDVAKPGGGWNCGTVRRLDPPVAMVEGSMMPPRSHAVFVASRTAST